MRKFTSLLLTTITTSLYLTACGGGGGGSSDTGTNSPTPNSGTTTLLAENVTATITKGKSTTIDFGNYTASSDGSKMQITSVVNMTTTDAGCNDFTFEENSLNLTINGAGVGACVYQYKITDENKSTSASAYAQIAVVSDASTYINNHSMKPISATANLDGEVTVQLKKPSTQMALIDSSALIGNGTVTKVDAVNNTITYKAGSAESDAGLDRITYSYSDEVGNVRVGVVNVTVSAFNITNTDPTAIEYTYNDPDTNPIPVGNTVTIDVTDIDGAGTSLVNDSDDATLNPDGLTDAERLQLVSVIAFDGTAILTDNTDLENTSFDFTADEGGTYYVTYLISDHKGGFATNIIEIYVEDVTWDDIEVTSLDLVFDAPLNYKEAVAGGYEISSQVTENSPANGGNGKNIPTFTPTIAESICASRGHRIPTVAEYAALFAQEGSVYIAGDVTGDVGKNWPIAKSYIASDSQETPVITAWDPKTGSTTTVTDSSYEGYVTCVDEPQPEYAVYELILNPFKSGFLIDDSEEQLTASFIDLRTNTIRPLTDTVNWSISDPNDSNYSYASGVTLSSTGVLNAPKGTDGFVKVTIVSIDGLLVEESRIYQITGNIVNNGGGDGSFNNYSDSAYADCGEEVIADVDTSDTIYGTGLRLQSLDDTVQGRITQYTIIQSCSKDLTTSGNDTFVRLNNVLPRTDPVYPDFLGRVSIGSNSNSSANKPFIFTEPGNYTLSIWVNWADTTFSIDKRLAITLLNENGVTVLDDATIAYTNGTLGDGVTAVLQDNDWIQYLYDFEVKNESDWLNIGNTLNATLEFDDAGGFTEVVEMYTDDLVILPDGVVDFTD